MDEFIFFIILMIVAAILERVQRSARKKGGVPPGAEKGEAESGTQPQPLGKDIQDLIAEELGINLERRPTVKPPPAEEAEPAGPSRPEVYFPRPPATPRQAERRRPQRERRPSRRARRDATARPRVVSLEEDLARRSSEAVSREESASRRPAEPISLERPRRPEDHERFHQRYRVPEPVATHAEFHERYMEPRGRAPESDAAPRLPVRPGWSPVARAIIWAEILGPPRALRG